MYATTRQLLSATQELASQHRTIEAIFKQLEEQRRGAVVSRLISALAEELIAHLSAEASIFYPAVRTALHPREIAQHQSVDLTIRLGLREMLESGASTDSLRGSVRSLASVFARHVQEQETGIFPHAERAIEDSRLIAIGAEILSSRPSLWAVQTAARPVIHSRLKMSIPPRQPGASPATTSRPA